MSPAERAWLAWLLASTASFAYLERRAFTHHDPALALTWALRRWLGISPAKPWKAAGIAAVWTYGIWVGAHISSGRYSIPVRQPCP